jgi:hypothetical protein
MHKIHEHLLGIKLSLKFSDFLGPIQQNFIFFVTYKQAHEVRVFFTGNPIQLSSILDYWADP